SVGYPIFLLVSVSLGDSHLWSDHLGALQERLAPIGTSYLHAKLETNMNWIAIIVFVLLFGAVTIIGFAAAHWRRGDLDVLNEWGLAGRRLGTIVIWFLLGGDVYTA